uniref:Collagen-like protein n=1 Tax=Candidatus Caldatribacterium saccharofermentans TaxID=1454753 RepID=A0A7V4WLC4_9BACT
MKNLFFVSLMVAVVLGLGLAYAQDVSLTDNGSLNSIVAVSVTGATVLQDNWFCVDQGLAILQSSGDVTQTTGDAGAGAMTSTGDASATSGLPGLLGALSFGGGDQGNNGQGGSSGSTNTGGDTGGNGTGAIAGNVPIGVSGNVALANQSSFVVAKNESDADVITKVITKVSRVNRVKIEDSYNTETEGGESGE